jgi:hypothetical protein
MVPPMSVGPADYKFRTSRQECGRWQKDYTELHRQILAGEKPPRYAMVYCTRGMADCLKGAITIFYFALYTGRAFQARQTDAQAPARCLYRLTETSHDVQTVRTSFWVKASRPDWVLCVRWLGAPCRCTSHLTASTSGRSISRR